MRGRLLIPPLLGVVLSAVYLALPPSGTDLSAAVAHADFAARFGVHPIDFRWYGGTNQFGYSLLSQYVMAGTSAKIAGALATAIAVAAFAALLVRARVQRPVLGGVAGAVFIAGNLISGRITWALGLAGGLLALVAVARGRRFWAVFAAFLASALSPVAGLFVGLAGVALVVSGRRRDGVALGVAAALPLAIAGLLFGQGGDNTISASDVVRGSVPALIVLLLVPSKIVRMGAALSAAGIAIAYAISTPVGGNALRLPLMFAVPVLLAMVGPTWRALVAAGVTLVLIAPLAPVKRDDLRSTGDRASTEAFFLPLTQELARREPTGRVEVPPLADYWDSVYVAAVTPLARGWLRQVDTARNPLFFHGSLTSDAYHAWLVDNGVQYVAVAGVPVSWVAGGEASIIAKRPSYLRETWRGGAWTLYAVDPSQSIVDGDGARAVQVDADGVTVIADRPGPVLVRVRYSRWLSVAGPGGCLRGRGRWSELDVRAPGVYRISSALFATRRGLCSLH